MFEWTEKDERQDEHLKANRIERGKSADNTKLEDRKADELRNRAAELYIAELDIKGPSKMKKRN